nr:MAG TPA: hypothetical protein [Caudoviricetes sp.]
MANKNFKSYLNEKGYEDLKQLWNQYASDKDGDAYIYDSVEDFAELTGEDGLELARKVFFGDIKNWGDDIYLDGYANFASCWSVNSSPIDLDVLADWLEEEEHDVFSEWKDGQPTFEEWLNNSYGWSDIIAMWEEYTAEDVEDFDLGALAESIEEAEGDEYLDYIKEIFK